MIVDHKKADRSDRLAMHSCTKIIIPLRGSFSLLWNFGIGAASFRSQVSKPMEHRKKPACYGEIAAGFYSA